MLQNTAAWGLLSGLFLTACAPTPSTVDLKYLNPSLPEASCADEPAVPASDDDQSAAQYDLDVLMAGRDCRTKFYENVEAISGNKVSEK